MSWEFTAFDLLLHTDLVRIVNARQEVSTDYIVLNRNIIQSSDLVTFSVLLIFLGFISWFYQYFCRAWYKGRSQIKRRTVQEAFTGHMDLTLNGTPIHMG